MPIFCSYGMCQNLGNWLYDGYCNKNHMDAAEKKQIKALIATLQKRLAELDAPSKESVSAPPNK